MPQSFGSFVVDLMARTPHLPEPGETVRGSLFQMGPGGKGANQAIAAKRAGCDLLFSTKLGTDAFADVALRSFQENGISTQYVFTTEQAPTGAALISVEEGTSQNSIIVIPGACQDLFSNRPCPGGTGTGERLLSPPPA